MAPGGSLAAYAAEPVWKDFLNRVESDATPVQRVSADSGEEEAESHALQGVKTAREHLTRAVYIQHTPAGSQKVRMM